MINMFLAVKDGLRKLNYILNRQQKLLGILVIFLSLIGAVLETLGVGMIVPFVQVFLNAEDFMKNPYINNILVSLKISRKIDFIMSMIIVMILLFILKNIYFLFLSWIRIKYSCKIQRELSVDMMNACMHMDYMYFVNESSAEIMKYINADTNNVNEIIYQLLRVLADAFIIVLISIYIFWSDWIIAIGVAVMATICLVIVYKYFRIKMKEAGEKFNYYYGKNTQCLLQALQGIKEVLVMQKQDYFSGRFEETIIGQQQGKIQQTMGIEWPAYIIEGLCVAGMLSAVAIKITTSNGEIASLMPVLSAFAVGAFRILPSLGRISVATNAAIYYIPSLNHVYEHLYSPESLLKAKFEKEKQTGLKDITFNDKINIENVSFRYTANGPDILSDLSMTIPKGISVGFVGQSGAGKTTLADIILCLLQPQKGTVKIDLTDLFSDDFRLSDVMGYVPQTAHITNDTIRNNVAFGVVDQDIDDEKVWKALEQAQIKEFVVNLPEKLETFMGDEGVRLSGGQRQRIAIARALYNDPEILIFDEATAALDNETEKAVMESIEALHGKKTLIIIAHRLTTIKECDVIYEVASGKAIKKKYEELVNCT